MKYLFVAGEHCDHETRLWAQDHFKVPVLDNWWQTETAHAIAATCVGLGNQMNPPKDASGKPVPGFDGMITVWSERFLYKVGPQEVKNSPIMYFAMYNSVVLSKILKMVVP